LFLTFFISSFFSWVGGDFGSAGPYFGIGFGLKGLAVIVLGGLGSISGYGAGGLLIGEAFVPADYSAITLLLEYYLCS